MIPRNRGSFSQRIVLEGPDAVRVQLRAGSETARSEQGEVILDLNGSGNWVRGFEIVGGFVPFSVAKAVSPFDPVGPSVGNAEQGMVTYDPEADAAFVYLAYDPHFLALGPEQRARLSAVSRSVNPTATYLLDEQGGLISVRVPIADLAEPGGRFLELLRK
jgi:uncharacterized protein YuzE